MRSTFAISASTSATIPAAARSTSPPTGAATDAIARARALGVDRKRAAEQRARVRAPQHDVRVGDGGPVAGAVARRPGIGARGERPDAQRARRVDPRDRAAARADFGEVDERKAHRIAAALDGAAAVRRARRFERRADLRHAAEHRAGFGGRAAHVERQHVRDAERAPDVRRGDDAARRPALDQRRGPVRRGLQRGHPAVGAHHEDRRLHAGRAHAARDAVEIRLHDRRERGVEHRRRKALVLAVLRVDLRRQRHLDVGDRRAQRLGDGAFVRAVDVGVQQPDGDRGDAALAHRRDGRVHGRRVERRR